MHSGIPGDKTNKSMETSKSQKESTCGHTSSGHGKNGVDTPKEHRIDLHNFLRGARTNDDIDILPLFCQEIAKEKSKEDNHHKNNNGGHSYYRPK
jgi:hypothetical protein